MSSGWAVTVGALVSTVLLLALLFAMIRSRARQVRGDDLRRHLFECGRPARATILELVSLQEAILSDPVIRTRVRLAPTDGTAEVEGTRDLFLSALTVPW